MPKLSRRGWNNVLIFAVLILMFFLYDVPQQLQRTRMQDNRLVPASAELLMVDFGNQRLVRAAGQWQIQPGNTFTVDQSRVLALAWQQTQLDPATESSTVGWLPVTLVSTQLAGQSEPVIWVLYQQAGQYLLQQDEKLPLYRLDEAAALQLFPVELR